MSTTSTTLTLRTAHAIAGKTGKVSINAERAERAINGASSQVQLHLAIHGKGIAQKTAATMVETRSLDYFLSLPSLDGGQWPDVYVLLANEFGFVVEGSRGKSACYGLVNIAQHNLDVLKTKASIDGATEARVKSIQTKQALIDSCRGAFATWHEAALAASANMPEPATA